jgi:glucans biosynthesis protein C
MPTNQQRLYYADWLRILAVFLLIPFHTAIMFVPPGPITYIRDTHTALSMSLLSGFLWMWFMPLLFFIAGLSTFYALNIRTVNGFIMERQHKLLLPLGVGMITLIPVQSYFKAMNQKGFHGSFIDFYPQFFNSVAPQGNFEWGHFWFLAYLFVYSLLTLPLFLAWRKKDISRLNEPGGVFNGWLIYAPALILMFIEGVFRIKWPGYQNLINDWANFLVFLTFYIWGFVYAYDVAFAKKVAAKYRLSLLLAITTTLAILIVDLSGLQWVWSYNPKAILYQMLHGLNTWLWVIFLIGLGSSKLNVNNRFLKYANNVCFPYYVLHFVPVTIIGFYTIQLNLPVLVKFSIITISSVLATLVLYELFLKRIVWLRYAFGLNLTHKSKT